MDLARAAAKRKEQEKEKMTRGREQGYWNWQSDEASKLEKENMPTQAKG